MSLKLFLTIIFTKIFLILIFTNFAYASNKTELRTAGNFCNLEFGFSKSFTSSNIEIIKIRVNENKKWIKNSMNIIKLKKYSIPEKYKKTFEGDIEIKLKMV